MVLELVPGSLSFQRESFSASVVYRGITHHLELPLDGSSMTVDSFRQTLLMAVLEREDAVKAGEK